MNKPLLSYYEFLYEAAKDPFKVGNKYDYELIKKWDDKTYLIRVNNLNTYLYFWNKYKKNIFPSLSAGYLSNTGDFEYYRSWGPIFLLFSESKKLMFRFFIYPTGYVWDPGIDEDGYTYSIQNVKTKVRLFDKDDYRYYKCEDESGIEEVLNDINMDIESLRDILYVLREKERIKRIKNDPGFAPDKLRLGDIIGIYKSENFNNNGKIPVGSFDEFCDVSRSNTYRLMEYSNGLYHEEILKDIYDNIVQLSSDQSIFSKEGYTQMTDDPKFGSIEHKIMIRKIFAGLKRDGYKFFYQETYIKENIYVSKKKYLTKNFLYKFNDDELDDISGKSVISIPELQEISMKSAYDELFKRNSTYRMEDDIVFYDKDKKTIDKDYDDSLKIKIPKYKTILKDDKNNKLQLFLENAPVHIFIGSILTGGYDEDDVLKYRVVLEDKKYIIYYYYLGSLKLPIVYQILKRGKKIKIFKVSLFMKELKKKFPKALALLSEDELFKNLYNTKVPKHIVKNLDKFTLRSFLILYVDDSLGSEWNQSIDTEEFPVYKSLFEEASKIDGLKMIYQIKGKKFINKIFKVNLEKDRLEYVNVSNWKFRFIMPKKTGNLSIIRLQSNRSGGGGTGVLDKEELEHLYTDMFEAQNFMELLKKTDKDTLIDVYLETRNLKIPGKNYRTFNNYVNKKWRSDIVIRDVGILDD